MIFEIIDTIFGIIKTVVFKLLYPLRLNFKNLPKASGSTRFEISKKSKVTIKGKSRFRHNVSLRANSGGTIKIGKNCFLNDGCSINAKNSITIGDNLMCGQNVLIFDHDHDYKNNRRDFICKPVEIGDNVWVGANSIILKGVRIGSNVVIGAGSLVNKDIPDNAVFYVRKENCYGKK